MNLCQKSIISINTFLVLMFFFFFLFNLVGYFVYIRYDLSIKVMKT